MYGAAVGISGRAAFEQQDTGNCDTLGLSALAGAFPLEPYLPRNYFQ